MGQYLLDSKALPDCSAGLFEAGEIALCDCLDHHIAQRCSFHGAGEDRQLGSIGCQLVQIGIGRAAAHDIDAGVGSARETGKFLDGTGIALGKRAVDD